jgi:hypothetical protein
MKRGYRDVGYLFAPHISRFRPSAICGWSWSRVVQSLATPIEAGNTAAVEQWFRANYPKLMELIPQTRHEDFANGLIDRAVEIASGEE